VTFVIRGGSVKASPGPASDPQAKSLGEELRARLFDIPEELLPVPGT
jgi:hypothetical protein